MKRLISYIIIIFFALQSQNLYSQSININRLELGDRIFSSGKYLIDRENGLHSVSFDETQTDTIFIAVHGFRSQGYEWVYALKKMAASNNKTFFSIITVTCKNYVLYDTSGPRRYAVVLLR